MYPKQPLFPPPLSPQTPLSVSGGGGLLSPPPPPPPPHAHGKQSSKHTQSRAKGVCPIKRHFIPTHPPPPPQPSALSLSLSLSLAPSLALLLPHLSSSISSLFPPSPLPPGRSRDLTSPRFFFLLFVFFSFFPSFFLLSLSLSLSLHLSRIRLQLRFRPSPSCPPFGSPLLSTPSTDVVGFLLNKWGKNCVQQKKGGNKQGEKKRKPQDGV